ncbi:MAG: glycosyltransferase family 2 protein [candidate division WOR-3 bacterium]
MVPDDIGVIIPAYNAENTIGRIIEGLCLIGFDRKNIILVDDGSVDNTAGIAFKWGVEVIRIKKNSGKGYALRLGFQEAISKGLKMVFTLDADGQHRVSEIQNFLKFFRDYDLIIGTRTIDSKKMPFIRNIVNRTTSLVISLLSHRYIPDVQSGFRLINLKIFDKVRLKTKNFQTESEIVYKAIKNGYRIQFVPVSTIYHNNGKSYINPIIDTLRFVNMAVRFLWV